MSAVRLIHALRHRHTDWPGERITGIREQLARTFEAGKVTSYDVDGSYHGRDHHDAHVHAAAVAAGADILLTFNVRDFAWDESMSPYEVWQPDDLLALVDQSEPDLVREATHRMHVYWMQRQGESDLPGQPRVASCPRFAAHVSRHLHELDTAGKILAWP